MSKHIDETEKKGVKKGRMETVTQFSQSPNSCVILREPLKPCALSTQVHLP